MTKQTKQQPEIPAFVKKFEAAYLAHEKSAKAIHAALIEALVDFSRKDNNTVGLFHIVKFMSRGKRLESSTTAAVIKWMGDVAQFNVSADGKTTIVKTRKKVAYDKEWLAACKAKPWYEVQKEMMQPKPWTDPMQQVISNYATGYIMGDVTRQHLEELFAPQMVTEIVSKALSDKKLQDKVAKRMEKLVEAA